MSMYHWVEMPVDDSILAVGFVESSERLLRGRWTYLDGKYHIEAAFAHYK